MSTLHVPDHASFTAVLGRAAQRAPEAFADGVLRNLYGGGWHEVGDPAPLVSPVDGTSVTSLAKVDAPTAQQAVHAAAAAHVDWSTIPLAERHARVTAAVAALADARDDLALLLAWEIGKPWRLACADVDRALDGVRWYLQEIDQMLGTDVDGRPFKRTPLPGPVSNIASWNYPMSVQVHAELVQLLAGNAVVAKTPTQGGAITLTLAHALMARAGLPVTLLSGDGATLSDALVRSPELGALAFVGGRSNGGRVAAPAGRHRQAALPGAGGPERLGHLEVHRLGHPGRAPAQGLRIRQAAVHRLPAVRHPTGLVDEFLAHVSADGRVAEVGHPLAVSQDDDPLPELDFGPLISAAKVAELNAKVDEALHWGAVPLYRGTLDPARFIPGQDTSAYVAPVALLAPPGASRLMHEEPFGPVDTIVVVDTEAELLAQMNASNGALVASIACDDADLAARTRRARPGVQGRHQQTPLPRRQGRALRRPRRLLEGRLRRRRAISCRPSPRARREQPVRQLPRLQPLPRRDLTAPLHQHPGGAVATPGGSTHGATPTRALQHPQSRRSVCIAEGHGYRRHIRLTATRPWRAGPSRSAPIRRVRPSGRGLPPGRPWCGARPPPWCRRERRAGRRRRGGTRRATARSVPPGSAGHRGMTVGAAGRR